MAIALKPTGLTTKPDWKSFINQQDEGYILILGPTSIGKTFSALSASEAFVAERMTMSAAELAKVPFVNLGDILHLGFDSGALDGIKNFGMAPQAIAMQKYIASLGAAGPVNFDRELGELLEAAYQPGMAYFIDDTLSSLDDILTTYYVLHKGEDTMAMWSDLAAAHSSYRTETNRFVKRHNLQRIALSHVLPKSKISARGKESMEKLKAEAENRDIDMLVPAITGKSAGVYINHASMMLALDEVTEVGKPGGERRLLCGKAALKYQTKNRHVAVTGESMTWNLGAVLRQIKSHRPA